MTETFHYSIKNVQMLIKTGVPIKVPIFPTFKKDSVAVWW